MASGLLGHGWRFLRRRGLKATVRVASSRFVYGSYDCIVIHASLAGPPAADRVGDVRLRLATPADLERLDQLEPYGRGAAQRAAVEEDNDWLFVACHGDRIVGSRLCSRTVPPRGLMSRVLRLGPGQVWGSDVFCLPEYRNAGIGGALVAFADRYLAARGYAERFGVIPASNAASMAMHWQRGSRPYCHVVYTRRLFHERLSVSRP
jgi:GNAT superfamily N-acetyltransferase